jgi:hypothetical protein
MKKFIAFVLSILLMFSMCSCELFPVENPTKTETVETTVSTTEENVSEETVTLPSTIVPGEPEAPDLTDKSRTALIAYASEFNWNTSIVDEILSCVPDMDMMDKVEKIDDTNFKLVMTDGIVYNLVIDAQTRALISIVDAVGNGLYPGCADGCN